MRPWWLSTLVLALLLTACAAPQQATPTGQGLELEGTSWVVTHIDGAATLASTQPTMTFTDGTVAGLASCNRYVADFTQSGGSIDLGEVAVTAMACADKDEGDQETQVLALLGAVTRYAIDGDTLTLTATDSTGVIFTAG